MNKLLALIIIISSSILLTGCGSKNKVAAVAGTTSFTDWASLESGQVIKGVGVEITSSLAENAIPTVNEASTDATVVLEVNTAGAIEKFTNTIEGRTNEFVLTTPTATVSQLTVNNKKYSVFGYGQQTDDNRPVFITGEPSIDGTNWTYQYQNYGAWMNVNAAATSLSIGAMSAGAPTSNPSTIIATYDGEYTGVYINDFNEVDAITVGNVNLIADFNQKSIAFSTSNHYRRLLEDDPAPADNNFTATEFVVGPGDNSQEFSGTLTINANNSFSGAASNPFSTANMNGTITGQFYGPAHEEAGGVFEIATTADTDGNIIQHIGSFGAINEDSLRNSQ